MASSFISPAGSFQKLEPISSGGTSSSVGGLYVFLGLETSAVATGAVVSSGESVISVPSVDSTVYITSVFCGILSVVCGDGAGVGFIFTAM